MEDDIENGGDESPPSVEPEDDGELAKQFEKLLSKVQDRDVREAVWSVLKRAKRASKSDMRTRLRLREEEKRRAAAEEQEAAERARREEVEARLGEVADQGGDVAAAARAEVTARIWRAIARRGDVLPDKMEQAVDYLAKIDDFSIVGGEVVDSEAEPVSDEDLTEAIGLRPELLRAKVGPGSGGHAPNPLRSAPPRDLIAMGRASQKFYVEHKTEIEAELKRRGSR